MKLPSYLRLTKFNTYVFRRRIPKSLLSYFETNEIRISLGKISKPIAIIYSRQIAFEVENIFYRLESNLIVEEKPTILKQLLTYKKSLIVKDEQIEMLEDLLNKQESSIKESHRALVEKHKDEIELVKDILIARLGKPAKTLKKSILLSAAIELYFAPESIEDRGDKLATVRKDRDSLKLFLEIIGNKPISEIDKADAAEFKSKVPLHGRKGKTKRAPSTVNCYMNSVGKFSGWLDANHSKEGHVKLDFSKLRIKKTKKPSEERDAFSLDEVKKMLSNPKLLNFKITDPAKYWLPYIAAYTGARLEEICQLNPATDIYQEDGIWIFDINENDGKSLKNLSSVRKVPIHEVLIKLGFLEYVDSIKGKSKILFMGETTRDGRVGKNTGKRVNRMIVEILGATGKTLHSFRHTFATFLKRSGVEECIAAAIMGHGQGGITYNRYGKEYLSKAFKPTIDCIKYY